MKDLKERKVLNEADEKGRKEGRRVKSKKKISKKKVITNRRSKKEERRRLRKVRNAKRK